MSASRRSVTYFTSILNAYYNGNKYKVLILVKKQPYSVDLSVLSISQSYKRMDVYLNESVYIQTRFWLLSIMGKIGQREGVCQIAPFR